MADAMIPPDRVDNKHALWALFLNKSYNDGPVIRHAGYVYRKFGGGENAYYQRQAHYLPEMGEYRDPFAGQTSFGGDAARGLSSAVEPAAVNPDAEGGSEAHPSPVVARGEAPVETPAVAKPGRKAAPKPGA